MAKEKLEITLNTSACTHNGTQFCDVCSARFLKTPLGGRDTTCLVSIEGLPDSDIIRLTLRQTDAEGKPQDLSLDLTEADLDLITTDGLETFLAARTQNLAV